MQPWRMYMETLHATLRRERVYIRTMRVYIEREQPSRHPLRVHMEPPRVYIRGRRGCPRPACVTAPLHYARMETPESSAHDLEEVRSELRRLGYLNHGFERFLLQDALRPRRPRPTLLRLTLQVGLIPGLVLATPPAPRRVHPGGRRLPAAGRAAAAAAVADPAAAHPQSRSDRGSCPRPPPGAGAGDRQRRARSGPAGGHARHAGPLPPPFRPHLGRDRRGVPGPLRLRAGGPPAVARQTHRDPGAGGGPDRRGGRGSGRRAGGARAPRRAARPP